MASPTILDLVHQHPRERLYVQPAEWKARHLELLEVTFAVEDDQDQGQDQHAEIDDRSAPAVGPDGGPVDPRPFNYWTHEAQRLALLDNKNAEMRHMLTDTHRAASGRAPFQCSSTYGHFYYGRSANGTWDKQFRLHGMIFAPARRYPAKPQPVVFAYVQRRMIFYQRQAVYPPPRWKPNNVNAPVLAVREKQIKDLLPADPRRDPYIVAILIGVAQEQARMVQSACSRQEDGDNVSKCAADKVKNTEVSNASKGAASETESTQVPDINGGAASKIENTQVPDVNNIFNRFHVDINSLAPANAENSEGKDEERVYKVCALVSDVRNHEYMWFYSAHMSRSFLAKFKYPSAMADIPIVPPSNLEIHASKFYYKPYSTLRGRMTDAIMAHHQSI